MIPVHRWNGVTCRNPQITHRHRQRHTITNAHILTHWGNSAKLHNIKSIHLSYCASTCSWRTVQKGIKVLSNKLKQWGKTVLSFNVEGTDFFQQITLSKVKSEGKISIFNSKWDPRRSPFLGMRTIPGMISPFNLANERAVFCFLWERQSSWIQISISCMRCFQVC